MRSALAFFASIIGLPLTLVAGFASLLLFSAPDFWTKTAVHHGATSELWLHPSPFIALGALLFGIGLLAFGVTNGPDSAPLSESDSHGSARFATTKELRSKGYDDGSERGGVVLCMESEAELKEYINHEGRPSWRVLKAAPMIVCRWLHTLVEGPPGSGKDESILLPTLLTDVHRSHVVLDPKGAAYERSAGYRDGYNVVCRFAPCEKVTARHNPLLEIPLGTDLEVTEAKRIASILADAAASEEKSSRIFLKSCVLLVTCAILHVMHRCEGKERSLPGVLRLLTSRGRDATQIVDALCSDPVPSAVLTANALKVLAVDKRMVQSAFTTMLDVLDFCTMPLVADAISGSDFVASDLSQREQPMTLYLVFPFRYADVLRPLARLMVDGLLSHHGIERKHDTCYDLNEVASLGHIPSLVRAPAELREYGVQLVIYVQSESQLFANYGKEGAVTILDSCRARVTLGVSGQEATKRASERLGKTTLVRARKTQAVSKRSILETTVTNTKGEGEQARELMTPDEVHAMSADGVLVDLPELHTYLGKRPIRYAMPELMRRSLIPAPRLRSHLRKVV